MEEKRISKRRNFFGLIVLAAVIVAAVLAVTNRRSIADWMALRDYQAPAAVTGLAKDDALTAYGRKIFYVNHPAIEGKSSFNQYCTSKSEQTIVLGCYHGNQNGIYILKVTDSRLDGVEQVTAAHEMLHAAYDRLSTDDRANVDAMLLDYYHHGLHNQRILDTIAAYKKSEPGSVVNEMHSVFGTEVANLPRPLENYYKKYFKDRSEVVNFAQNYQAEFTSRQTAVKNYDEQLANLRQQIDTQEADLKNRQAALSQKRTELNSEREAGDIEAYNSGVSTYNSLVENYNGEVQDLKSLVSQYNQTVKQRNAIVLEQQQLANSINSHVSTIDQR